jgi:hypothetical protein
MQFSSRLAGDGEWGVGVIAAGIKRQAGDGGYQRRGSAVIPLKNSTEVIKRESVGFQVAARQRRGFVLYAEARRSWKRNRTRSLTIRGFLLSSSARRIRPVNFNRARNVAIAPRPLKCYKSPGNKDCLLARGGIKRRDGGGAEIIAAIPVFPTYSAICDRHQGPT